MDATKWITISDELGARIFPDGTVVLEAVVTFRGDEDLAAMELTAGEMANLFQAYIQNGPVSQLDRLLQLLDKTQHTG